MFERIVVRYLSVIIYLLSAVFNTGAVIPTEDVVELKWEFSDCGVTGRFGPTQDDCDDNYEDTNLEGDIEVSYGIQIWTVPVSGLYLVTALGPSGAAADIRQPGKGANLTAEFHMTKGQRLKVLVGQQSDFSDIRNPKRPVGGSGGTYIVRESDGYVLMVAGGGSSGSGTKWNDRSVTAGASLLPEGQNASLTRAEQGYGGEIQSGGRRGVLTSSDSASGGGSGYQGDGEAGYIGASSILSSGRPPRAAKSFLSKDVGDKAPGVGGYFVYTENSGTLVFNNGGFGGGGAGSADGGAGGGGGYSGGGGGALNGWGGGGGSINNGGRQRNYVNNGGRGSVIISFIGHQCCGPIVVYIAMTFIAGVLATILIGFVIIRLAKVIREYDGSEQNIFEKFKQKFRSKDAKKEEKQ